MEGSHDSGENTCDNEPAAQMSEGDTKELLPSKSVMGQLRKIIHSNKFQIGVLILVAIDCILVMAELLIDLRTFETANQLNSTGNVPHAFHSGASLAAEILHFLSIAILSIFLVELCVKIVALGKDFFKLKMELLDAAIIIISFALDVAFLDQEGAASAVGLLVLLRLWRIARIMNGVVLSVKTQSENRLNQEKRLRQAVEEELARLKTQFAEQKLDIASLQSLLSEHSIPYNKVHVSKLKDQQPLALTVQAQIET